MEKFIKTSCAATNIGDDQVTQFLAASMVSNSTSAIPLSYKFGQFSAYEDGGKQTNRRWQHRGIDHPSEDGESQAQLVVGRSETDVAAIFEYIIFY